MENYFTAEKGTHTPQFYPAPFVPLMVNKILAGCKTKTRRILVDCNKYKTAEIVYRNGLAYVSFDGGRHYVKSRYGQPGDILWLREFYAKAGDSFIYKADDVYSPRWLPPMLMPKRACRYWMEVVSLNVERLHDITEKEAMNEGAEKYLNMNSSLPQYKLRERNYRTGFAKIWFSIHGAESWNQNPWVLVVGFRLCPKPSAWRVV